MTCSLDSKGALKKVSLHLCTYQSYLYVHVCVQKVDIKKGGRYALRREEKHLEKQPFCMSSIFISARNCSLLNWKKKATSLAAT